MTISLTRSSIWIHWLGFEIRTHSWTSKVLVSVLFTPTPLTLTADPGANVLQVEHNDEEEQSSEDEGEVEQGSGNRRKRRNAHSILKPRKRRREDPLPEDPFPEIRVGTVLDVLEASRRREKDPDAPVLNAIHHPFPNRTVPSPPGWQ